SCECGEVSEVPASFAGEAVPCPACRAVLRLAALPEAAGPARERLVVRGGPGHVGEQIFLGGDGPLMVGKAAGKDIVLAGNLVSRSHCRLVRGPAGWRVEDERSTNGLFVNRTRVGRSELNDGDVLQIGEYELEYRAAVPAP